ncbi:MAG: DUF6527 family protein [Cyanobacteria bacterium P01_H01_bin.121]
MQKEKMKKGKLRIAQTGNFLVWCPGCSEYHVIDQRWTFNGNYDSPTFNPSLLVTIPGSSTRCHAFIRQGQWQFLSDCNHMLAGQTVSIPVPPADA